MCGDAWHIDWTPERTLVVVADGLGHGPDAAVAASTRDPDHSGARGRYAGGTPSRHAQRSPLRLAVQRSR